MCLGINLRSHAPTDTYAMIASQQDDITQIVHSNFGALDTSDFEYLILFLTARLHTNDYDRCL